MPRVVATVTCAECGEAFQAKSPRARYCSPRCRKAANRRAPRKALEPKPAEPAGTATGNPIAGREPEDPLVEAVREELEKADALGTVDGQIALHLARQVKAASGTAASSLAKELRAVLDRVIGSKPPAPAAEAPPTVEDDEVRRAREARERKAREAAAG